MSVPMDAPSRSLLIVGASVRGTVALERVVASLDELLPRFQIERHVEKAGAVGPEVERMARQGRISPDLWMKGAVGAPVGSEALLEAAAEALGEIGRGR